MLVVSWLANGEIIPIALGAVVRIPPLPVLASSSLRWSAMYRRGWYGGAGAPQVAAG